MTDRMELPETGGDLVRESQEQNRDGEGRFAEGHREPEQGGQAQAPAQPEGGGEGGGQQGHQEMIPHARFHAVNEELRGFRDRYGALESRANDIERTNRELQQQLGQALGYMQQGQRGQPQAQPQQPEAPPPDPFTDPEGFSRYHAQRAYREGFQPFEEDYRRDREAYQQDRQATFANHVSMSREIASVRYGDEVVRDADTWLKNTVQSNPAMEPILQQMIFAPGKLPAVEMVKLYQGQAPLGRPQSMDPLVEAEVNRRLAAMGHAPTPQPAAVQGQPAPNPAAQVPMPSSFANARGGGPRPAATATGPRSLSEIMGR